jgi:hypothetical protein
MPPADLLAVLLNPCAAALDQDHQHDDKQHARDNADNRGTVHFEISLFRVQVEMPRVFTGYGRRLCGDVPAPE